MTTRSNPFKVIERLFEPMGSQFEDSSRLWEAEGSFGLSFPEFAALSVDIIEHDDAFVVTVNIPGFTRDEVEVQVTDHTLSIEADHEETAGKEEKEEYLRHERREDAMQRSIRLPEKIDRDGVTARMNNGVLTVTLPKLEVEEALTIEIDE